MPYLVTLPIADVLGTVTKRRVGYRAVSGGSDKYVYMWVRYSLGDVLCDSDLIC